MSENNDTVGYMEEGEMIGCSKIPFEILVYEGEIEYKVPDNDIVLVKDLVSDVEIVMLQTGVDKDTAEKALVECNGDIVNAIMQLNEGK